jgi:hypothetical protein
LELEEDPVGTGMGSVDSSALVEEGRVLGSPGNDGDFMTEISEPGSKPGSVLGDATANRRERTHKGDAHAATIPAAASTTHRSPPTGPYTARPMETRVLFIVGKGRSGTTLLGNLIGQADGFVSVGELWRLWHDDPAATLCGCGVELTECELWSGVIDRVGIDEPMRREVLGFQNRVMAWRSAPAMLWRPFRPPGFRSALEAYGGVMGSLYTAIAAAASAEVVVDSSKWPLDAGLLGHAPGTDGRGVHVVRDPRAVAHSWRRRKVYPGGREMPRFSPMYSAMRRRGGGLRHDGSGCDTRTLSPNRRAGSAGSWNWPALLRMRLLR